MVAPARPEELPQFQAERPDDIRRATPWHRYAHHINTLPRRLQVLAQDLDVEAGDRLLDLGCADVPYRHFFPPAVDYVAADIPGNPNATMSLNPDGTVPSPEQSFDAVLSTQVLEHVSRPALYLEEAFRVLRPGGRLLLSTHGTFAYHPDPADLWRWTCAGLRLEVERAGFEVIRFEGIIGPVATGLQLIQDVTIFRLPRLLQPAYALVMQSLARLSDRLERQWMRDLNGSIYALVAERPSA
jgi:SAM-dependent methyltransferase